MGEYSRRIAPADNGVACRKNKQKKTILVSRFAGPVSALVRNQVHRPTEGVQGYQGSHWLPPSGEYGGRYMPSCFFFEFFHRQTRWKRGLGDVKAPNNNRGMTYQSNGKE